MCDNFHWLVAAVKFAEQAGDGFHDERIRVAGEKTKPVFEVRNEPQFGEAAGDQMIRRAQFRRKRRQFFRALDQERQAVLTIFQRREFGGELKLFSREVHGAEKILIDVRRRLFRFRRTRWFLASFRLLAMRWTVTGFLATRLVALRLRMMMPVLLLLLMLLALRLDAAQRAAKFLDLTFVGELLALSNFDEFENFIHLVVQFLQRRGDEHRVFDGLADGRGCRWPEIGGFDPLFLARRLGLALAVVWTLLAAWFARHFTCT
jgi:hypothetical protein